METPWKGVLLALQGLFADLSKQAGGRAPGPTPSKLWDVLMQRLDAAGGRAVPPAQVLTWMLECLDRALLPGNLQAQRAHTPTLIKHLFGLQAEEGKDRCLCGNHQNLASCDLFLELKRLQAEQMLLSGPRDYHEIYLVSLKGSLADAEIVKIETTAIVHL